MFKNTASQKIALFAFTIATGAAKTGDAANLTAYVSKDFGAVTVLGDTSATEMDATNAPGWYLFDLTQAESNFDDGLFTGKSSTGGVSVVGRPITTVPPLFTTLSIDGSGRVDVIKIAGTTQTAGDVFARIGAPAGASLAVDVAAVKVDTAAIKTKTDFLPSATAGAAGGVFIAGSNAATSITTALTANVVGNVTGNLSGSVGSVTGAVGSVIGAVGSVTGAVGSVTGPVGSVTGNVGGDVSGNVAGSVASVLSRVTANTDQLAGQTVTAAAGVTFPTSVASPTNITAGTIATVTNLTNAPTAGDFTATMKTSIGTAVAASAVASVTGAVGSVTGLTPSTIADQVWDEALSGHAVAGSTGAALSGATAPSAATVADAVWDELIAGHAGVGSTGAALAAAGGSGDPWATALPGSYGAGTAGKIVGDNINAAISSRLATGTVAADVTATKAKTDQMVFTVTNQVDVNVVDWKGATAPAMTGDAFARLGAPAGASHSADVAAVKVDTAAVKVKTDFLPSATAGAAGGVFIAGSNAATSITTALTANVIGNVTGNLSGSVGSVAGAVGSVTGLTASDVGSIKAKTDNLPADPADASDIATSFGTVASTLSTIAGYIDTEVGAIKAKTDLIPAAPAAVGDVPTAAANAAAVLAAAVDGAVTVAQSFRLANSALGGKASGLATTTAVYRDLADSKDRITGTVDADGNRSTVALDLT